MDSLAPAASSQNNESARTLFAALVEHLRTGQNSDGGWSFHAGGESRVEPTCWALLALTHASGLAQANISRGLAYLQSQQLNDGSWPAAPAMSSGGWVTSLAALTLANISREKENERSLIAGLQWLCEDYPRDSSRWQKFLKSLSSAKHESHNDEFRGWGWTPRTSSWVEPTAFALLAFSSVSPHADFSSDVSGAPGSLSKPGSSTMNSNLGAPGLQSEPGSSSILSSQLLKRISDRRALAVGLLYDRMCAGGGWNCGNPRVYGVDGDSLILPTCWALLALRDAPDHPHRALSLAWLQKSFATIASPGSLAVAQITLENYSQPVASAPRPLTDFSASNLAGQGTHIAAWAALALNRNRIWPSSFHESPVTSHESQT